MLRLRNDIGEAVSLKTFRIAIPHARYHIFRTRRNKHVNQPPCFTFFTASLIVAFAIRAHDAVTTRDREEPGAAPCTTADIHVRVSCDLGGWQQSRVYRTQPGQVANSDSGGGEKLGGARLETMCKGDSHSTVPPIYGAVAGPSCWSKLHDLRHAPPQRTPYK